MTSVPSTIGLFDADAPASTLQQVQWGIAAGTVDIITVAYPFPNTALSDGLCLAFRAFGANTVVAPTFSPDGLQAYPIVKKNLVALSVGDIAGFGHEVVVRFLLANSVWVAINLV
jgi:hypothetical protein